MLKRGMRFLFCVLALAACVHAPDSSDDEELSAAPGSIADGLIAGADADDVFEIVHNGLVSVRHIASGMPCHFGREGVGASIRVHSNRLGGEDASCTWQSDRSFYIVRIRRGASVITTMAAATAEITALHPDARILPAENADSGPPHETRNAAFLIRRERVRQRIDIVVTHAGDWVLEFRFTGPVSDDQARREALGWFWSMAYDVAPYPPPE
jgi:hypothetical protein